MRSKANRVAEVVKVRKKLKEIHLDACPFEGIVKLKQVMTDYINLDETKDYHKVLRGKIPFEEYGKVIEYRLPMVVHEEPMVRIVKAD